MSEQPTPTYEDFLNEGFLRILKRLADADWGDHDLLERTRLAEDFEHRIHEVHDEVWHEINLEKPWSDVASTLTGDERSDYLPHRLYAFQWDLYEASREDPAKWHLQLLGNKPMTPARRGFLAYLLAKDKSTPDRCVAESARPSS